MKRLLWLALFMALASPCFAGMAVVQAVACDGGSGATSISCTITASTSGNVILGICAEDGANAAITISDSSGNYTSVGVGGTATTGLVQASAKITAGAITSVTCAHTGTVGTVMFVLELSGAANPLANDTATTATASTAAPNPGNITLASTASIFVAAWENTDTTSILKLGTGYSNVSGTGITTVAGNAAKRSSTATDALLLQVKLDATSGSQATAFAAGGTSNTWRSLAVSIRTAAGGAPAANCTISTMGAGPC